MTEAEAEVIIAICRMGGIEQRNLLQRQGLPSPMRKMAVVANVITMLENQT